ncbi:hypothetical protein ACFFV8_08940 [Sphingobium indicum]|nr:hypothetical protein [Sphingobium indicum]EQB06973.1 hypothetical protein L286_05035 [Sphingobium sp. HDIP04]
MSEEEETMRPDSLATGRSFDPALRGYIIHYHPGEANHCPSCGRSQWMVGRLMAECAYCETALPLENNRGVGACARFVSTHDVMASGDPRESTYP